MAQFEGAFERTLRAEGGYLLHNVSGDSGGLTYAGIARNKHPRWAGWSIIDRKEMDNANLTALVRDFYRAEFWNRISGDEITDQAIAEAIYDFSVNAGHRVAVKLAQIIVRETPDGIMGPKTIAALNSALSDSFVPIYAIAKIKRYADICNANRTQSKFLLGWVNRTLRGLE